MSAALPIYIAATLAGIGLVYALHQYIEAVKAKNRAKGPSLDLADYAELYDALNAPVGRGK